MEARPALAVVAMLLFAWQAHAAVNCSATGVGRFAEPSDTTCKNYTLCVYDSINSSYLGYTYTCPATSVFNPNSGQCTASSNYACNSTKSSVCTTDGYIADPSFTDCSSYIECVEINGTFTETTYTCPDDTYFNPNTTLCDADYNCTNIFTCTSAGRFANSSDTTCKTYHFCVLARNRTYYEFDYVCPSISVFNPASKVCTTKYTCS